MNRSRIEWTEVTWNPLTGCTKVSPGCKHCYAERMAKRLQAIGQALVEGRLAVDPKTGGPRIWTAKDGTARADFEIVAERVEFLGGQQALIQADGAASDSETVPSDEDIPF